MGLLAACFGRNAGRHDDWDDAPPSLPQGAAVLASPPTLPSAARPPTGLSSVGSGTGAVAGGGAGNGGAGAGGVSAGGAAHLHLFAKAQPLTREATKDKLRKLLKERLDRRSRSAVPLVDDLEFVVLAKIYADGDADEDFDADLRGLSAVSVAHLLPLLLNTLLYGLSSGPRGGGGQRRRRWWGWCQRRWRQQRRRWRRWGWRRQRRRQRGDGVAVFWRLLLGACAKQWNWHAGDDDWHEPDKLHRVRDGAGAANAQLGTDAGAKRARV